MFAYWLMELRVAFRSLFKRPQFVATVVFTLALSMAAVISLFSISSLLLFQALPYQDAEQQYAINLELELAGKRFPSIPALQRQLVEQQTSFTSIATLIPESKKLTVRERSFDVETAFVSANYFSQLGVPFGLGNGFGANERLGSFSPKAVLSFELWQTLFSKDQALIGKQVQVGDNFFTVVGVLAQHAEAPDHIVSEQPSIYLPLDYTAADLDGTQQVSSGEAHLIGKGIAEKEALYQAQIQQVVNQIQPSINHPIVAMSQIKSWVLPLREAIVGGAEHLTFILLMGAVMLLLVACTNLANLFIARSVESTRKFAIHMAVGAKDHQLFNKLFIESALLILASGVMALLLSVWGIELIKLIAQDALPRLSQLSIDGYTLGFSMVICCLLALAFSFFPYAIAKQAGLSENMRASGKGSGQQGSKKSKKLLLVGQSCLVAFLLCFSSLFLQSSLKELNRVTGFETDNRSILTLKKKYESTSTGEFTDDLGQIRNALKQQANVTEIAMSNSSPVVMSGVIFPVRKDMNTEEYMLSVNKVEANFFSTLGVEFEAGQTFSPDQSQAQYSVILNLSSAELLLGKNWQLGQTVVVAGRPHELIGVVKDTFRSRYLANQFGDELVFTPYNRINGAMLPSEQIVLNLHHKNAIDLDLNKVFSLVNSNSQLLEIEELSGLATLLEEEVYVARVTATVALSFCVLTLVLATIGVWGIVNYNAQTRRFEFGVRMALGAKKHHLLSMMLKECSRPMGLGLIVGLIGATLLITQVESLKKVIDVVGQYDLNIIITMVIMLVLAMLFAVIKPVSQVVNGAPMRALKQDD